MAWRRLFRHAEDILCVLKSEVFLPITSITDYPDSIRSTEKGEEASTLLRAIAAAAPARSRSSWKTTLEVPMPMRRLWRQWPADEEAVVEVAAVEELAA